MSRFDDDLSPFRDDPLFQALTGPATPDELAGEAEALAAFRAANAGRPRRRMAVRLGTSGAVAAVAVALSGGAAAAYTAALPAPVQRTLHAAFGPIGVPAPEPEPVRVPKSVQPTTPAPVQAAGPVAPAVAPPASPTNSPSPQTSSGTPSAKPTASASPTASTLPLIAITPTASPTPTSSSSRPPIPGATLGVTTSDNEVAYGTSVTITGKLTDETGAPVVNREIVLVERLVGEPGWTKVTSLGTSALGEVGFTVPALEHNARFALHAGGHVRSNVITVAVDPTITTAVASAAQDASETTVTVTVVGAEAGDVVVLDRLGRHRMARTADLSATGEATFTVPVPMKHTVRYRVVVRHTEAHHGQAAFVEVSPPELPTS